MEAKKLIKELNKGILYWYPFKENAKILLIENQTSPLKDLFSRVDVCELSNFEQMSAGLGDYDYVIVLHAIEQVKDLEDFLLKCKKLLAQDGKLLLAMDNRLGVRYFCGDRDPYTRRNFDGIEDYRRISSRDLEKLKGRTLDRAVVETAIENVGFQSWKFFSVFPNIDTPQLIYAEDYMPEEDLSMRYIPMYHYPDSVFLEEAYLYDSLIRNHMFHQMANGYFIECVLQETLCDVKHVTLSMDRGERSAMVTLICGDGVVKKKAVYNKGQQRLVELNKNHEDLIKHGVNVVRGMLKNNVYEMPYIKAPLANVYLQNLLRDNKEQFIHEMDRFRDIIMKSSDHVEALLSDYEACEQACIADGVWLKRAYFDLVPLNSFYYDGEYVFFDQEFCIENCPANAVLVRVIDIVYGGHLDLEAILPREYFFKRYKMEGQVEYLRGRTSAFLNKVRHQNELRLYNETHGCNYAIIPSNRQRMNHSEGEYQNLFMNVFVGLDKYKVLIFGSGVFAKKFVDLYGDKYTIAGILDNNKDKWGEELKGIKILSPDILQDIDVKEYKVIICIKNYLGVLHQLQDMGISQIGVYDVNVIYPAMAENVKAKSVDNEPVLKKRYRVGYIAGVFDLYHIGHLNMFKRAKKQCEYLIVGVVSDEGVRKNKKTVPFIPFEERIEMVRSCKYVDEAVEIPLNYGGTRDAYRLYHFDVQFSGSDYENDPNWLAEREFLRKHGSDMVFFPYTEQTSSTKIKALINKQLEEQ